MPTVPGLLAMPTVIMNTLFSGLPDRSYAVRSSESLAVIAPMYNEAKGAGRMLRSLLAQRRLPEHIVLSINGGEDDTYGAVRSVLQGEGFMCRWKGAFSEGARLETWSRSLLEIDISIVVHPQQTSKSHSVNMVLDSLVTEDRILISDGDTEFAPGFIAALHDNFYRLRVLKRGQKPQFVLEDFAVQSGSVTSFAPPGASRRQRFISAGRKAEYAFATVLRAGQAKQMGRTQTFGNSRLYTVIGCGFAVRRDLFPVPTETETEDHDFTLLAQNVPAEVEQLSPRELGERGLTLAIGGEEVSPEAFFDPQDKVLLKKGGNARFVEDALMATEDPPHLNGFVRQIERWNGGGQQNFLKRLGRPLKPNVRFALWTALVENLLGLLLLALVPLALALNWGNPSIGLRPEALAAWFGFDALLTFGFVVYGFLRQGRAEGLETRALPMALRLGLKTTLPFLFLRYLNPLAYLASATRVVPQFLRQRFAGTEQRGVAWERASTRRRTRTQGVLLWSVSLFAVATTSLATLAPYFNPINEAAWRLVHEHAFVDMRDYDQLPFMMQASVSAPAKADEIEGEAVTLLARQPLKTNRLRSSYCPPDALPTSAPTPHRLLGETSSYEPLTRWGLVTLARLAPLLAYVEDAATAYDVPVKDYLKILLNESYLDPLAIGDTDDKGVSQVTSDALTLLKAISLDRSSAFYNPQLFPATFSVFDPDFSICAGAAKFAWARQQPRVSNLQEAYALYINPVHGFTHGSISERHLPLTQAMLELEPMASAIGHTLAAYREDPNSVTKAERKLINIAFYTRRGDLGLEDAYRASFEVIKENELKDREMFQAMLTRYFGIIDLYL